MKLGNIDVDSYDLSSAVHKIAELVHNGNGGIVFTPNVDHIILSLKNERFKEAYEKASLKLPDGMPIVWASKLLLRTKITERVTGSDLFPLLLDMANDCGYFIYFLGSSPSVLKAAQEKARQEFPDIIIHGHHSPSLSEDVSDKEVFEIMKPIIELKYCQPDIIFVAFGAPKQEIFISKAQKLCKQGVFIGVGAAIDFYAGSIQRAPIWMQRSGLEWFYRLYSEPRRMWKRYLRDLQFPLVVAKELMRIK